MNHKHYDVIMAWAMGALIQYQEREDWLDTVTPQWTLDKNYRVKPQNKVKQYHIQDNNKSSLFYLNSAKPNLELTFSPEGKLINSKVL